MPIFDDGIKHVILLMLENHSFDQMLGDLNGVDGINKAQPFSNPNGIGKEIPQAPTRETQLLHDPWHETRDVLEQQQDGQKGFIRNFQKHYPSVSEEEQKEIMGYYPKGFLPAMHALAENFVICDRWFSSLPGPTWPNRFFALSGTSRGMVRMPENHRDFAMLEDQTQDTIFDRLNEKQRSWKVYYYDFPCSLLLKRQREPGKSENYRKISEFFHACESDSLPDFCLIEPKFDGTDQNDDHPPHNIMKAQKLIADVYNAVRANEQVWSQTLLVVVYDEHGGFADHVIPPATVPPDNLTTEYDFKKLGIRVPALLISPWTKAGVCSETFDHTSLLRYLSDKWDLNQLTRRVDHAKSIACALSPVLRSDPTPKFIRIAYSDLQPKRPELELVDQSRHHIALASYLEDYLATLDSAEIEKLGLEVVAPFFARWYQIKAWLGYYAVKVGYRLAAAHRKRRSDLLASGITALFRRH